MNHDWRRSDRDHATQTESVTCLGCGATERVAIDAVIVGVCKPQRARPGVSVDGRGAWDPPARGRPKKRTVRIDRLAEDLARECSRDNARAELWAIGTGGVEDARVSDRVAALALIVKIEGWMREPEEAKPTNRTEAQIAEAAAKYLKEHAPHMLTEQYRTKGEA